jgi:hypothetical protein
MKQSMLSLSLCVGLGLSPLACVTSSNNAPGPVAQADAGTGTPDDSGVVVPSTCPAPTKGPTTHRSITADETWTADTSPHMIPFDIGISAKVTLEPCAEVRIAAGATITLDAKGSLVGDGTASNRILIAAQDPTKPWAVIRAIGGSMHLAYATIQDGGDPGNTRPVLAGMLYGQVGSDPATTAKNAFSLQHVTLKGSKSNGVVISDTATFSDDSTDLVVTGSAQYPISLLPRVLSSLPAGTYTGNAQDEILLPGSGVTGDVVTDQTMHDRGVPYHVGIPSAAGQFRVGASSTAVPLATLTIEAGVVVRFQKGAYFEIEHFAGTTPATGALIAKGTADKPILLTSAEVPPAPGDWVGLTFGGATNPTTVVDHMEIQYAGLQTTGGSLSCAAGQAASAVGIFGQPPSAFITNSKFTHCVAGIDSGWDGTQLDFTATNTFTDVPGCKLTNPPDGNHSCTGRPACAVP